MISKLRRIWHIPDRFEALLDELSAAVKEFGRVETRLTNLEDEYWKEYSDA